MTDTTMRRTYTDTELVDELANLFATDDPINGGDLVELVGTMVAHRAPADTGPTGPCESCGEEYDPDDLNPRACRSTRSGLHTYSDGMPA